MKSKDINLLGLTTIEVEELQIKYGKNILTKEEKESIVTKLLHILKEPMFLLLIISAIIYFVLGEPRDGIIMLVFVIGMISIDVIQEWKTDKTLKALKNLSSDRILVKRNGKQIEINSINLVPGDLMIIHEGVKIPADGLIIKCTGLSIDESSLTGEAEPVFKNTIENKKDRNHFKQNHCYAGTLVIQGNATILVEKIGSQTEYGKIGVSVQNAPEEQTTLQKQISFLIKICAWIAAIFFAMVTISTFVNLPNHPLKKRLVESILTGITLAMAMIPEEFPVVLTIFLSMGAWRLAKKNSLIKKLPAVETLGAISTLCVDKTGTITMNHMTVLDVYGFNMDEYSLCKIMGLSCEEQTFDPMEKAMLKKCRSLGITKKDLFSLEKIREYPFSSTLKMTASAYKKGDEKFLAIKGSPESILKLCKLDLNQTSKIINQIEQQSKKGARVIAIAYQEIKGQIPSTLSNISPTLCGIVSLIDPPRPNINIYIKKCIQAGIRIIMITGDNGLTASAIANKIGIQNSENIITGDIIDSMNNEELKQQVKTTSIFSRVIPEHKMRIVKALKENGEIVAMTGDGVNDAPALKYADIGISMGQRGQDVSREASDLILMDDNFKTIVDTIKDGRRIYDNIRKAIGYIFTIHIPIACTSLAAPLLGISGTSLPLLPLHIVLLELIIDPTCSIIFERQPPESNIMNRPPRNPKEHLITPTTLLKSLTQGIVMFLASFLTYYLFLKTTTPKIARTMGLLIIMISNLFLVQVNSSDTDFAYVTIKKLIKDKVMWIINILTIVGIIVITYSPLNTYLKLAPLSINKMLIVIVVSFISVFWYEIVKLLKKIAK